MPTSQPMDQMEFAVNMTCQSCVDSITQVLNKQPGVQGFNIDLAQQRVVVTTNQPSTVVQQTIESTGLLAVYRAQGQDVNNHLGAAVSILKDTSQNTFGLIRFIQRDEKSCVVDGALSNLTPSTAHALHVHETGDIRNQFKSTGDIFRTEDSTDNTLAGDLGNMVGSEGGTSTFRYTDNRLKVWDLIGRSVCLHDSSVDLKDPKNESESKILACGVIARSAGLFENTKKVCACTGKTLWQERQEMKEQMN